MTWGASVVAFSPLLQITRPNLSNLTAFFPIISVNQRDGAKLNVLSGKHLLINLKTMLLPCVWTVNNMKVPVEHLFLGPEWTNSHQCTSWSFCPLDGLCFFIWRQMGFITIHSLLTTILFLFLFVFYCFFLGTHLKHNYFTHLPTLISIVSTLVPYYLSLNDIATLVTSYLIDLTIILTTYLTNLTIMLSTYPTNLSSLPTWPLY